MKSLDEDTTIDKLLENDKLLGVLVGTPDRVLENMVTQRRRQSFKFMWDILDMDKIEVLSLVREREDDFIEAYEDCGVPEWMMRMEAQDVLLSHMKSRFEEEGIM
jgi:hypothetical protein